MSKTYKITDMDALEKACPEAVQVVKSVNRPAIGRLFKAAQEVGMTIPGIEAVETDNVLENIPEHIAKKK